MKIQSVLWSLTDNNGVPKGDIQRRDDGVVEFIPEPYTPLSRQELWGVLTAMDSVINND